MIKPIFLGISAFLFALTLIPLFAAFEAHVINVTARIENALQVDASPINFGTIFPEESLEKPLTVALSQSFQDEPRVDGIGYHLRQKPKCGITSNNGQMLVRSSTKTGEVVPDESSQHYHIDCGPAPRPLNDGEAWGVLPLLCPYLSKHFIQSSDDQAPSTPIFLLDTDESTYTTIFRVNLSDGNLTTIGSIPITFGFSLALAAKDDNTLYAVTWPGEVLEITVSPFSVMSLGNIGNNFTVGLAYANGQLLATDETSDTLSIIRLTPVAKIVLGVIRLGSAAGPVFDVEGGDIAEDESGHWFLWGNAAQALYRLDAGTAVVVPVNAGNMWLGKKTGLAFDYLGDDALLSSSGFLNALIPINPVSGTSLSSVNFCLGLCPPYYNHYYGDMASPKPEAAGSTPSFHQPFSIVNGAVEWLDTPGRLSKALGDFVNNWIIDVHAPCFLGQCAQDWADYVHKTNPTANPDAYIQPIENEHKIFGCDLWVEVTDVK